MGLRPRLRSHADVVFPGEGEDGEQVGEDEEVADFLVEAAELDRGTATFRVNVKADDGAESHGVHVGEVGEVEDDMLVVGQERGDGSVELIGVVGGKFSVAADEGSGAVFFDLDVEGRRSGGGFHAGLLWGNLFYRAGFKDGSSAARLPTLGTKRSFAKLGSPILDLGTRLRVLPQIQLSLDF